MKLKFARIKPYRASHVSRLHWFHRWSKWEIVNDSNLVNDKGGVVGRVVTQQRKCVVCDLLELKQQRISLHD
jgi:hypothetical protein